MLIHAWVAITLVAALLQTWRTALQQRLRSILSVNAVGLVRYLYALPVDGLMLGAFLIAGRALPVPDPGFLALCAIAGLAQILGTSLLILAFGYRGFTVGTAYAKTDSIQAALAAWLLVGQTLPMVAWAGVAVGVAGVMVLSLGGRGVQGRELLAAAVQPGALCGLGAGGGFALAGVVARLAIHRLPEAGPIYGAVFTLALTNLLQTAMQGGWMLLREPGGVLAAFAQWRRAAWVGALSGIGSACWFSAFAMAPVALVRTVGQADLALVLLFSRFYLRERARGWDIAGVVLIGMGVVLAMVG